MAFAIAAIGGLVTVNIADDLIHYMRTGHYADGGATIFGIVGIPVAAAVAAVVRWLRTPGRTCWRFAALCGFAAAPITLGILYL
jgi:hypothetical protein